MEKCRQRSLKVPKIQGIACAGFIAGKVAEVKPLPVGIVWYNNDVEICGCSWSMVKTQKPRAKKKI